METEIDERVGMSKPVCTIIAGVNGSGKTTFALNYLIHYRYYRHFINAYLIASGWSPLLPEQQQKKIIFTQTHQDIMIKDKTIYQTIIGNPQ